jgi:hypothetical protein
MSTVLELLQNEVKKQYKKIISPNLVSLPSPSLLKDKLSDFMLTASPDNGFQGKTLSKDILIDFTLSSEEEKQNESLTNNKTTTSNQSNSPLTFILNEKHYEKIESINNSKAILLKSKINNYNILKDIMDNNSKEYFLQSTEMILIDDIQTLIFNNIYFIIKGKSLISQLNGQEQGKTSLYKQENANTMTKAYVGEWYSDDKYIIKQQSQDVVMEHKYRLLIRYTPINELSSSMQNSTQNIFLQEISKNIPLSYLFYKTEEQVIINFKHKVLTIIEYKNIPDLNNSRLEWFQSYQIVYFPPEGVNDKDQKMLDENPSLKMGAIRSEGWIDINYHKSGVWNHYDREGNLTAFFNHLGGMLNGPYEVYHSYSSNNNTMRIKIKGHMINGCKTGKEYNFYLSGAQYLVSHFNNGKKEDKEYCWYESGHLKSTIPYVNNLPNGIYREWNDINNKIIENEFVPLKEQKVIKIVEYNNGNLVVNSFNRKGSPAVLPVQIKEDDLYS